MHDISLKEDKHNYDHFPCGVYEGRSSVLHWHREVELLLAVGDRLDVRVNGAVYPVEPGEMIYLPSQCLHTMDVASERSAFIAIVFNPVLLSDHYYTLPLLGRAITHPVKDENIQLFMHSITLFEDRPLFYQMELKSHLLMLMKAIMVRQSESSGITDQYDPIPQPVKNAIQYLHDHYQKRITIDELSDQVNFSKYYLIRVFKKYTGYTPVQYLNSYRMRQAVELLRDGQQTVAQIAHEVGYESESYFVRKFREQYKCTPTNYWNPS